MIALMMLSVNESRADEPTRHGVKVVYSVGMVTPYFFMMLSAFTPAA
jgi:hypothetical protein